MIPRTALITGSSKGIGAAIARAYANNGMRVAVHYNFDVSGAREVLTSLPGEGHVLVQGDIANPLDVQRIVNEADEALGGLGVLVCNAAIYEFQPFDTPEYADWLAAWQRLIDIDLYGSVNAAYCALPGMRARGGGKVIFIGSRGGFRGETDAPAYAAAKMGLVGFCRSLAKALAKEHIYSYVIAPGWVDTDMSRPRMAEQMAKIEAEIPMGRVATPEDVAGVALFLASEAANYLTGTTIDVNGASYFR